MERGLLIVKPGAYPQRDSVARDIEEYGLSIEKRIKQRWTREKIRQTYPLEMYPKWPLAPYIDQFVFERFGKDPEIEAMIIFSEKESMKKIKEEFIGPLDAAFFQRPEDKGKLRTKYGLRERVMMMVEVEDPETGTKEKKPFFYYHNGIHLNPEGRFEFENKLYTQNITL